MKRRTNHLCALLLAQAACLGVGLWMHYRFLSSATTRAVEDRTWADLQTVAGTAVPEVETALSAGGALTPADLRRLEHSKNVPHGWPAGLLVVDPKWRIVVSSGSAEPQGMPHGSAGMVTWRADPDQSTRVSAAARGTLVHGGEPRMAVAHPLGGGRGFLIAHRSRASLEAELAALTDALPAVGGLTFIWTSALIGIAVYLITARFHDVLDRERSRSTNDTLRQAQQLVRARDAVIFGLAKLAESRDPDTGDHLERISVYCTSLAAALRRDPRFAHEVTPAFVQLIGISSALHDIGKVGVEDRILRKPAALTDEERVAMQNHTMVGGKCLREIEQRLGGSNFLQMAREIAFCHHEHWDGSGYPERLSGASIPLSARVVAIADVYDALSSPRVYKPAMPHEECVTRIRAEAGKKLDPALVEVWLTVESKFRDIAARFNEDAGRGGRPRTMPFESQAEYLGESEELVAAAPGPSEKRRSGTDAGSPGRRGQGPESPRGRPGR
jgi:HD-GYP domain-containing protein (c-di-GMP phosphodiesterase class II)